MGAVVKRVLFDLYDTLIIHHDWHRFLIEEAIVWKVFKSKGINIDRQAFYEKLSEIKKKYSNQTKPKQPSGAIEQELAQNAGYNVTSSQP